MACLPGERVFSVVLKVNMAIQVGREGIECGKNKPEGAQAWYFYVITWMKLNPKPW